MGVKRTKAAHGDRVVNTTTGETGTIYDTHEGSKKKGQAAVDVKVHYSVLRDTGPRVGVVWEADECEWEPAVGARTCKRCNQTGHTAIDCPNGDMP
jgi:hypothetical protein